MRIALLLITLLLCSDAVAQGSQPFIATGKTRNGRVIAQQAQEALFTSTLLPQSEPWQATMVNYMATLPPDSFDVMWGQDITWDSTYSDTTHLREGIWLATHEDGDDRRSIPEGQRYPSAWYTIGEQSVDTLFVVQDVYVRQSLPATSFGSRDSLLVRAAAGDSAFSFLQFDISGFASRPNGVVRLENYVYEHGSEDVGRACIGFKVYNDLAWDEATATWNSPPVDLSPVPAYEDLDCLGDDEQLAYVSNYLTQGFRTAFDTGATTVTVALYSANSLYSGEGSTTRTAYLASDSAPAGERPYLRVYYNAGIEATDMVRYPDFYAGDYNYSGSRGGAFFSTINLPLAGGGQGNPYYDSEALKRRSMVLALLRAIEIHDREGPNYGDGKFWGSHWNDIAYTYDMVGSMLPDSVQQALETWFLEANDQIQRLWTDPLHPSHGQIDNLGNLDIRPLPGALRSCAVARHYSTELCEEADSSARAILFGSKTGHAATSDHIGGVYMSFGCFDEADGCETSYHGRSIEHTWEGYVPLKHEDRFTGTTWNFAYLDTVLSQSGLFTNAQIYRDIDGEDLAPSQYASRTEQGMNALQDTPWQRIGLAAQYYTGRPFKPTLATDSVMVNEAATWIASIPTPNQLDEVPPLPFGDDGATASEGRGGSPWPPPVPEIPVDGNWAHEIRSYEGQPSSFPFPYPQRDSTYLITFDGHPEGIQQPYFTAVRSTAPNGRTWSVFLEHQAQAGGNVSHAAGTVQVFWDDSVGVSVIGVAPRANQVPDPKQYEMGYHNSDGFDSMLLADIYGTDESGQKFSLMANDGNADPASPYARTVTRSNEDSTITFLQPADWGSDSIHDGGKSDWLEGTALTSGVDLDRKWTATIEPDGLALTDTITYSGGTDEIATLYYQVPFHGSGGELSYWADDGWTLVGGNQTVSVDTDTLRWKRGNHYVYHYFDAERPLFLSNEFTSSGRTGRVATLDLHPNSGTAVTFPAETAWRHEISVTDPGLVGTASAVAIQYPQDGETVPQGEIIAARWQTTWGTSGSGTQHVETSTDCANYTDAGLPVVDNGDGTFEAYGGDWPAAGAICLRIRIVDGGSTEKTSTINLTSAAPSQQVVDSFTDTQGTTLTNHTPETNNTSAGWLAGNGTSINVSDEAEKNSGSAFERPNIEHDDSNEIIVEAELNNQGTLGDTWPQVTARARQQNKGLHIYAEINDTGARVSESGVEGTPESCDVPFASNASSYYRIRLWTGGTIAAASFYEIGGTHLGDCAIFDVGSKHSGNDRDGAGFRLWDDGETADNFKTWTF